MMAYVVEPDPVTAEGSDTMVGDQTIVASEYLLATTLMPLPMDGSSREAVRVAEPNSLKWTLLPMVLLNWTFTTRLAQ